MSRNAGLFFVLEVEVPFGPYADMDDCISKNQDKGNPGAYCAQIHKDITGQWPGEMAFTKRDYQAMPSRTIRNVEIFAAGEHNGDIYTVADLDQIIKAFYALRERVDPPVKIGHSSDEFNIFIAEQLGIPAGLVSGDGGEGSLAFGWVDNLRRYDDILVADIVNVPESIVTLIESKLYRHVSCELICDFEDNGTTWPYVLSGLALLGAEQQAVSEISNLDTASVFVVRNAENIKTYEYEGKEGTKTEDKNVWKDFINRLKSLVGLDENDEPTINEDEIQEAIMLKEVNLALGIAEDAGQEDTLAAINELKAKPEGKQFSDLQGQVKTYKDRAETAEAEVKKLTREGRLAKYTAMASEWKAVPGKPEDIASQIVTLEDSSPEAAGSLVATYQRLNETAVAAGLTAPIGTAAEGDTVTPFEKKVKEYEEKRDNDGKKVYKTYAEAFTAASKDHDDLFKEYRKQEDK